MRTLADRRRGARWWALGTVVGVATVVGLWPTIRGNANIDAIVEDLPATMRVLIGAQAAIPISSAPGYLQARLFSTLLPVLLLVYGIGLGAAAIGGAEEDGTLELVVVAPIARARVALERLAASVSLVLGLAALALAAMLGFAVPAGVIDHVSPLRFAVATAGVTALALLHLAVAFAVGCVTGRRVTAVGATSALAVGGYLLYGLAASSDALRALRPLSPWSWLLERNLLVQSAAFTAIVLPTLLAAGACLVGLLAFVRRDLRLP